MFRKLGGSSVSLFAVVVVVVAVFSLTLCTVVFADCEFKASLIACDQEASLQEPFPDCMPPPAEVALPKKLILESLSQDPEDLLFLSSIEAAFPKGKATLSFVDWLRAALPLLRIILPDLALTISRNKATFLHDLDVFGNVVFRHVGTTIIDYIAVIGAATRDPNIANSVYYQLDNDSTMALLLRLAREDSLKQFLSASSIHYIELFINAHDMLRQPAREADWSRNPFSFSTLTSFEEMKIYFGFKEQIPVSFFLLFATCVHRENIPDAIDYYASQVTVILDILSTLDNHLTAGSSQYKACLANMQQLAVVLGFRDKDVFSGYCNGIYSYSYES